MNLYHIELQELARTYIVYVVADNTVDAVMAAKGEVREKYGTGSELSTLTLIASTKSWSQPHHLVVPFERTAAALP